MKPRQRSPRKPAPNPQPRLDNPNEPFRLNKYIAHAGHCSRRDADLLIQEGRVQVNGKQVIEMGHKVTLKDTVTVNGERLVLEPHIYILLNKGRNTISTTRDEKGRHTVLDAIEEATGYRVYPVGRLDRNTTGILLLTNDGDLANKLMHPSHKVKKTYEAVSSRMLSDEELQQLRLGVKLEDGMAKAISVKRSTKEPLGVVLTVQEGRNHLIRRMIAHFGAEVLQLKRTRYGGLTSHELRIGRWRYLRDDEVEELKRLTGSGVGKSLSKPPAERTRKSKPNPKQTAESAWKPKPNSTVERKSSPKSLRGQKSASSEPKMNSNKRSSKRTRK